MIRAIGAPRQTGGGDQRPAATTTASRSTPTNAYADDASHAEDTSSGTNTNTCCGRHRQGPARLLQLRDIGAERQQHHGHRGAAGRLGRLHFQHHPAHVRASSPGTAAPTGRPPSRPQPDAQARQTYTLGGNGDTWGHTWTPSELSDANFRVRITDVANNTQQDFYLDWAAVKVYYTPPPAAPAPTRPSRRTPPRPPGSRSSPSATAWVAVTVCSDTTPAPGTARMPLRASAVRGHRRGPLLQPAEQGGPAGRSSRSSALRWPAVLVWWSERRAAAGTV